MFNYNYNENGKIQYLHNFFFEKTFLKCEGEHIKVKIFIFKTKKPNKYILKRYIHLVLTINKSLMNK